ncbi:hypothetical protein [Bdellovibrio sp. KM01]|uniref:hypothetical protein n=1 Tax=Bdellovibrio sp. KM01 TaxID=2748865 RepID=UPI0015EAD5C3|nr:hypothetical protein [Bdellovibrio sp. KM01]QLY26710.1 hypothetical protein HW988_06795 [Bdellovibrio sp. KM01]
MITSARVKQRHIASFFILTVLLGAHSAEAKSCGSRQKVVCSGIVTGESSSGNITYVLNRVVYNSCGKVVSDKFHRLMGSPADVENELRKARCPADSF